MAAQILFGGADSGLVGGNVSYVSLGSSLLRATSGNESQVAQVMPVGGTLSNFNVLLDGTPGTNNSYTFVVRKNMTTDSTVTCTISGTTEFSCSDNLNSVTFSAGDLISIRSTPSGGPNGRRMAWTAKFVPAQ